MAGKREQTVPEFFSGFLNQASSAWVEDPVSQLENGKYIGTKSYLSYRVLLKQTGRDVVGVRHRYSEFEHLRKTLRDRYMSLGIFVPTLPPKLVALPTNSKAIEDPFIRERILMLGYFCEMIVGSPWLRNDSAWKDFMKSESKIPGSSVVDSNDKDSNEQSIGEIMLLKALNQLETPSIAMMTKKVIEIKAELSAVKKTVETLLEHVRAVQSAERSLEAANKNVYASLSNWLRTEKKCTSYFGNDAYHQEHSNLEHQELPSSVIQSTALLFATKIASNERFPEHSSFSLVVALEQELSNIQTLNELCSMHSSIQSMIEGLQSKLNRTVNSKSTNRGVLMQELGDAIQEKELCLSAFYKGFEYVTLPVYARRRAGMLRKLTGVMAASTLTSSYTLVEACRTYFASQNIHPGTAIKDSGEVLAVLGMGKLEIPPEEAIAPLEELKPDSSGALALSGIFSIATVFAKAVKNQNRTTNEDTTTTTYPSTEDTTTTNSSTPLNSENHNDFISSSSYYSDNNNTGGNNKVNLVSNPWDHNGPADPPNPPPKAPKKGLVKPSSTTIPSVQPNSSNTSSSNTNSSSAGSSSKDSNEVSTNPNPNPNPNPNSNPNHDPPPAIFIPTAKTKALMGELFDEPPGEDPKAATTSLLNPKDPKPAGSGNGGAKDALW